MSLLLPPTDHSLPVSPSLSTIIMITMISYEWQSANVQETKVVHFAIHGLGLQITWFCSRPWFQGLLRMHSLSLNYQLILWINHGPAHAEMARRINVWRFAYQWLIHQLPGSYSLLISYWSSIVLQRCLSKTDHNAQWWDWKQASSIMKQDDSNGSHTSCSATW